MSLIIFGHPRSRTNLICSHIVSFPKEIFDLTKVNDALELDWTLNADPRQSIYEGKSELYLEKLRHNLPSEFKLFGFHLQNWPACFTFIQKLNYPAIRVYRSNKYEAILSLLIGQKRGWTSHTQKDIQAFDVTFKGFQRAYNAIVVYDEYWKNKMNFAEEIEYEDVPALIADGVLQKYGIEKKQFHRLDNQESIKDSKKLIKNIGELQQWYELMCAEKF